jgi:TetR/AcrR family transcriptional regulator
MARKGEAIVTLADRKEREKEQRRSDIINAAEKLFFSRGCDNVSMNDIAS